MKLNLYQIDTFTDKTFGGNSACVVPLDKWLPDDILIKIAKENAVAETAFFVDKEIKYICVGSHLKLKWTCADTQLLQQYIV